MRIVFLLVLSTIFIPVAVYCQEKIPEKSYIQDPTLSVGFLFHDFRSASLVRATSLSAAIRNNQFGKIKEMSPGLSLNYLEGITEHFDVSITFAGSFLDYPMENRLPFNKDYFLMEGDISVRGKMFTNRRWVAPYLQVGVGSSFYAGYYAAFIPAGAGLQVSFFDEAYLLVNAQYRVPVTAASGYHFYYSLGLAGKIGRKKQHRIAIDKPLPTLSATADRDGDLVPDSQDVCPDTRGSVRFKGCPDTDGDEVPDSDDKCPTEKGLKRLAGCPEAVSN
jgi:OmpA-OmpF porin, OOP family